MELPKVDQIQVVVRARSVLPTDKGENGFPPQNVVDITEGQVIVGLKKNFVFDNCFDGDSTQESVYKTSVEPLVKNFIKEGCNSSILAYGQTGAGKTHTIFGKPQELGIIPRAIEDIFKNVDTSTVSIGVSFFEILNEKLYDLLSSSSSKVPLSIREEGGQFLIPNLTVKWVSTVEEASDALVEGSKIRTTGSTAQNNSSSRSHAIFRVNIARHSEETGMRIESKLNLVDLAGSESAAKTHAQGERLLEGNSINKGLLALGNCISAISKKQPHIPFRNSTLTKVLRECFLGEGLTTVIACISPIESDLVETINTLRYADHAKAMKKPPIPAHLLAQHQASDKKRRLGLSIAPTPAKWRINSTIDNGTPTPRKFNPKLRLNSTTPVGKLSPPGFATSTLNRRPMTSQMAALEESDEMSEFGSLSDISSIHGGPTTSSVISSIAKSANTDVTSQQNQSILFDPSVLSPYLKQFASKMFEQFEMRRRSSPRRVAPFQKPETDVRSELDSQRVESSHFDKSDAEETLMSGNGLAEARERTRKGYKQTNQIQEDEKENENFLSKKVVGNHYLTDRQHRKRSFLQQVEPTASPSFGQDSSRSPKRRASNKAEQDIPMSPNFNVPDMDIDLDMFDFAAPTFPSVSTKPTAVPGTSSKRSTRRTTMLMPDLRQSLNESGVSSSRRRSVRIATKIAAKPISTVTEASFENTSRRRSVRLSVNPPQEAEFKNPLEVTSNWKIQNQQRHNKNILGLLNSANFNVLKSLPAIGPKTAFILHSHRELHNGFRSLEDLKTIPGQKNFFAKFCKLHQIEL